MNNTNNIEEYVPTKCPICGEELLWSASGVDLYCKNPNCCGTEDADLHQWTSSIADVHGLGWNIKNEFFTENNINTVEDLYNFNLDYTPSTVTEQKIYDMFKKLRYESVNPISALCGLNIPRLGWKSAEQIYNDNLIDVLLNVENLNEDEFIASIVSSVGSATAVSIWDNRNKLSRLNFIKDRFMVIKNNESSEESKGEVMITGKLSMKRKDFEKVVVDAGYSIGSKIHKDTTYLITNTPNSGSSKNKKADELNITKITEEDFLKLIQ